MGDNMCMKQLSFLPEENIDPRPPMSVNWNLWHGCTRASTGCLHCYMYRRDESIDKDPSIVTKTDSFNLPVRILRSGANRGRYKIPCGSHIYTCFSSDFFHKDADEWRDEAWVADVHSQCIENGISFFYHQTGAKHLKDGKLYNIPRHLQHAQAHRAGLDT